MTPVAGSPPAPCPRDGLTDHPTLAWGPLRVRTNQSPHPLSVPGSGKSKSLPHLQLPLHVHLSLSLSPEPFSASGSGSLVWKLPQGARTHHPPRCCCCCCRKPSLGGCGGNQGLLRGAGGAVGRGRAQVPACPAQGRACGAGRGERPRAEGRCRGPPGVSVGRLGAGAGRGAEGHGRAGSGKKGYPRGRRGRGGSWGSGSAGTHGVLAGRQRRAGERSLGAARGSACQELGAPASGARRRTGDGGESGQSPRCVSALPL